MMIRRRNNSLDLSVGSTLVMADHVINQHREIKATKSKSVEWFSMFMRFLPLTAAAALSLSCSSLMTNDFAGQNPEFNPIRYFTGKTSSSGVRENGKGAPVQQVFTETRGRMKGEMLFLEQDLTFGTGSKSTTNHRSWRLKKTGPHTYEGSANDIIGTVRGEAHGNVFHWSFLLTLSSGNPFSNIRMSQWMYLQPDGKTMLNHTTITKVGIVVSQVTEQFAKE